MVFIPVPISEITLGKGDFTALCGVKVMKCGVCYLCVKLLSSFSFCVLGAWMDGATILSPLEEYIIIYIYIIIICI